MEKQDCISKIEVDTSVCVNPCPSQNDKIFFLDYDWKNKLRFVRIYFDTPTFDKITKDRAAKFEDMLSSICGTMGLLTGFSIINGVEILYFSARTLWSILKRKNIFKTIVYICTSSIMFFFILIIKSLMKYNIKTLLFS